MKKRFFQKFFLFFLIVTLFWPGFFWADSQGQIKEFFVKSDYDLQGREKIKALLRKISQKAYFYLEKEWWESFSGEKRAKIDEILENLAQEFDKTIYPQLTSTFGSEWTPGIDNDEHLTIFFHRMKEGVAGYFRSGDEYQRIQSPFSNQREMIYLNSKFIFSSLVKSHLAHEFFHLITFNQKERLRGVSEEIWLNEARADYTSTFLGYDEDYSESNLQQRIKIFLQSPSDSLIEWQNQKKDYGIINVFFQYLVDHYGEKILVDSLNSSKTGILSLNQALKKNGFEKKFEEIFTDWTIAIFLQDCQINSLFCYKNKNLKNLRIAPSLIFLPSTQKTKIFLNYSIKPWSGNWYRIVGGQGELRINFKAKKSASFQIPYVLCQDSKNCQVKFLLLDKNQEGRIKVENFGKEYTSLTLIPSVQISNFSNFQRLPFFDFSLSILMETKNSQIERLKTQITALKAQIAALQAKIREILRKKVSCQKLKNKLYFGQRSGEVRCLQQFLAFLGREIYPERLVTGFFGPLTKKAVIRFQEKYAEDILHPLGLKKGTGFVGMFTLTKINRLLQGLK